MRMGEGSVRGWSGKGAYEHVGMNVPLNKIKQCFIIIIKNNNIITQNTKMDKTT